MLYKYVGDCSPWCTSRTSGEPRQPSTLAHVASLSTAHLSYISRTSPLHQPHLPPLFTLSLFKWFLTQFRNTRPAHISHSLSLVCLSNMGRAPCCEKVGLKKGRWTAEEDETLMRYIQENGQGSWRSLPKKAGRLEGWFLLHVVKCVLVCWFFV